MNSPLLALMGTLSLVPVPGPRIMPPPAKLAFWLRICAYGVYFAVMFVVLTKAIRREAAEAA